MLYRIGHQIRYTYSAPVFPEPHIFRLRPRCDSSQHVLHYSMSIDPEPVGRHDFLDSEGNCSTCIWFEEQVSSLTVSTAFDVQTFNPNPFTYLVTENSFFSLPFQYTDIDAASLAPFLSWSNPDESVKNFTRSIIDECDGNTIDFLSRLCSKIYENFTVEIRHEGLPYPPAVTIEKRRGACRDLASLYIAACRSAGLASRFVSGYQIAEEIMEHPHLHAWAEVYIPGGGWRGYDPTHGLVVADHHVALAASHDPGGASPVAGTFRGTGISAEMSYRISFSIISD